MIGIEKSVVPLWEKYLLTVEEAAQYFGIGESKLRKLAEENEDSEYILCNGNRRLYKRKLFEEYIDRCQVI